MVWPDKKSEISLIQHPLLTDRNIKLGILRDDLLHPGISGNKWRKLKYNILEASEKNHHQIVTVGGSHSNHIAAVAEAGKVFGFNTIGLIRGYEAYRNNPTLMKAAEAGMDIRFLDKASFSKIDEAYLSGLKNEIGDFFFVPMGGANSNGERGCREIMQEIPLETTHVCVPCGTGSTLAGILNGNSNKANFLGFPVMKNGNFLKQEIKSQLIHPSETEFDLALDYHFNGFGKMNQELASFIKEFSNNQSIALDGVYNGKMMFGIFDLIKSGKILPNSVITAIHTGGVQGNQGLNQKYGFNLPLN